MAFDPKKFLSKTVVTIIVIVVIALGLYSCTAKTYNNLVSLDEQVNAQWAQVENQYQRRYDLVPNLVSTVKGYAKQEADVFTQVAEARSKAGGVVNIDSSITDDPARMAEFQKVQDTFGGTLQRLLSVTENYPELKSNQNFISLQDELEGTENRIAVERKRYNDTAKEYNTTIRKFPATIIANMTGFQQKAYFTASSEAQTAPKVEF